MGLFDTISNAFTGAPVRKAAEQNRQLYGQYQTQGMGYLDAGYNQGTSAIDKLIGSYAPFVSKYGAGTSLGLDALGVNGPEGNARATGAFQAGPGFQFAMNQGLDALDRRAASRGMLNSGNTNLDTIGYAQGLANQEYGNWRNQLLGLSAPEMQAVGGVAGGYGAQAQLAGQTARDRIGVAGTATGGIAGANMSDAQAQMQASGNLWGAALGAANLGAGIYGRYQGGGAIDRLLQGQNGQNWANAGLGIGPWAAR